MCTTLKHSDLKRGPDSLYQGRQIQDLRGQGVQGSRVVKGRGGARGGSMGGVGHKTSKTRKN